MNSGGVRRLRTPGDFSLLLDDMAGLATSVLKPPPVGAAVLSGAGVAVTSRQGFPRGAKKRGGLCSGLTVQVHFESNACAIAGQKVRSAWAGMSQPGVHQSLRPTPGLGFARGLLRRLTFRRIPVRQGGLGMCSVQGIGQMVGAIKKCQA